jgi:hypothetical protein
LQDSILKISSKKTSWKVSQAIEWLPCKCEALSEKPELPKKTKHSKSSLKMFISLIQLYECNHCDLKKPVSGSNYFTVPR